MSLNKNDLALENYNKAIELEANNSNLYLGKGLTLLNLNQYQLALRNLIKALS